MADGGKAKYDGTCREKGLSAVSGGVVRFKSPLSGTTVLEDVIKGNIVFQNQFGDKIFHALIVAAKFNSTKIGTTGCFFLIYQSALHFCDIFQLISSR